MDRFDELRWKWRMLVLDILMHLLAISIPYEGHSYRKLVERYAKFKEEVSK